MKKLYLSILILIGLLFLFSGSVEATSGALQGDSITTCNGQIYGMHGDGHWHVAEKKGDRYYPVGGALGSNPCNSGVNSGSGSKGNSSNSSGGSSSNGNGSSSSSASTGNVNFSGGNNSSNANGNAGGSGVGVKPDVKEEAKSDDVSLKEVNVSGKSIDISDSMSFETTEKKVDIVAKATSSKAKVVVKNTELKVGENIIGIDVIAENGNLKTYELKINRLKKDGTATISKFVLDSEEIIFKDNMAVVRKREDKKDFEYSYKLSGFNAKLVVYHNGRQVDDLVGLEDGDVIQLVVVDNDDNETMYEITVRDKESDGSSLISGIVGLVISVWFVGIITVGGVYILRKKNDENSIFGKIWQKYVRNGNGG